MSDFGELKAVTPPGGEQMMISHVVKHLKYLMIGSKILGGVFFGIGFLMYLYLQHPYVGVGLFIGACAWFIGWVEVNK